MAATAVIGFTNVPRASAAENQAKTYVAGDGVGSQADLLEFSFIRKRRTSRPHARRHGGQVFGPG
jgi:hypothetical protein